MEDHVTQLSEYLEKSSISNKSIDRPSSVDNQNNYGNCNSSHSIQTHYYHDQNCGDCFNQGSKSKRSSKMDLPSCKFHFIFNFLQLIKIKFGFSL